MSGELCLAFCAIRLIQKLRQPRKHQPAKLATRSRLLTRWQKPHKRWQHRQNSRGRHLMKLRYQNCTIQLIAETGKNNDCLPYVDNVFSGAGSLSCTVFVSSWMASTTRSDSVEAYKIKYYVFDEIRSKSNIPTRRKDREVSSTCWCRCCANSSTSIKIRSRQRIRI